MPTKQETYDIVAKHLLTQNKKAVSVFNACRYRVVTDCGVLKCAAGCLIPDEEYDPGFEGATIQEKPYQSRQEKVKELFDKLGHNIKLLNGLQTIHDIYEVKEWRAQLAFLAKVHGLSDAVLS